MTFDGPTAADALCACLLITTGFLLRGEVNRWRYLRQLSRQTRVPINPKTFIHRL